MLWGKKRTMGQSDNSKYGLIIVLVKDLDVLVMFFLRVLARDVDPYS